MLTYLEQMQEAATRAGVDLRDAVLQAGLHDSNYYRWINGNNKPSFATTRRVIEKIREMGRGQRGSAAA